MKKIGTRIEILNLNTKKEKNRNNVIFVTGFYLLHLG